MSKTRGKEITISPVHSKTQQAFDYLCRVGRATGSEIAAAVPGLEVKNVPGTLQSRITKKDILVESSVGPTGRIEKFYMPAEQHRRAAVPAGQVTEVPVAQTHAMTSVLKTGTRFGPNAAGGPIRDTGPARDKGSPITLGYTHTTNPENLPHVPKSGAPAKQPAGLKREDVLVALSPAEAIHLATDIKEAVDAAQRQIESTAPAIQQAVEMRAEQREEMERDLRAGIDKPPVFWLSDDGSMIIEDPAQSICLKPADTARLHRLLAGCVSLKDEVTHAA